MDTGEARSLDGREFLTIESIPGIVLAAGAGRRFGGNKLLALVGHRPVIYRALQAALGAPLDPVSLVVGHEYEKVLTALDDFCTHPRLHVLYNAQWQAGRASSLRLALDALPPETPGAVVLLGDMPLMTSSLIARVVRAFTETKRLCFPVYQGSVGRPVALPRELFAEFAQLQGDQSGLRILERQWESATRLELSSAEEATQCDLDTMDDWQRVVRHSEVIQP
jgi:molybdenum cofactor cytidylyltransferase